MPRIRSMTFCSSTDSTAASRGSIDSKAGAATGCAPVEAPWGAAGTPSPWWKRDGESPFAGEARIARQSRLRAKSRAAAHQQPKTASAEPRDGRSIATCRTPFPPLSSIIAPASAPANRATRDSTGSFSRRSLRRASIAGRCVLRDRPRRRMSATTRARPPRQRPGFVHACAAVRRQRRDRPCIARRANWSRARCV